MNKWTALAAAVAVTIAAGCSSSSGGKGGGAKTITQTTNGGQIVFAGGQASFATAQFIKSISPEPPAFSIVIGDGHCELQVTTGTGGTPTYADAGTVVNFVNGATTIAAVVNTVGGISYSAPFCAPQAAPSDWVVSNDGGVDIAAGTFTTIHIPAAVTGLAGTITAGSDATLTWAGGTGADTILISLSGNSGSANCYAKPGSTSLTVPAAITTGTGAATTAQAVPATVNVIQVGGRDVIVEGATL
jgi:hypothetical protein